MQLCSFEHVPGATVCKHLYRHYRLPDGRLVHMYLTDRLHEQVQGLADPDPPPPLALDDICQVQVPPPPPPPRIVHDQAQATGRQLAYGDGANHKATPTTAMARLRSEARAMTPQRPLRPKVVLPYRFRVPLAASPDVYGPAPPLPPDEPPMFVVVRKRRRYRGKDLKAELAAQAAKFRKRQEVLLQKHVITSANSFKRVTTHCRWCCVVLCACSAPCRAHTVPGHLLRAPMRQVREQSGPQVAQGSQSGRWQGQRAQGQGSPRARHAASRTHARVVPGAFGPAPGKSPSPTAPFT